MPQLCITCRQRHPGRIRGREHPQVLPVLTLAFSARDHSIDIPNELRGNVLLQGSPPGAEEDLKAARHMRVADDCSF